MNDYDIAAEKLALSEDELLIEFGKLLAGPSRDGGDQDRLRRARNWFTNNHAQLRETVCGNDKLTAIRADPEGVVLLAEVLGDHLNQPAVFGVSAYLLKHGLDRLCAE